MKLNPYPHQEKMITALRVSAAKNDRILLSSPTGSGKSFIFSAITSSAFSRGYRIWVIVPLTVLLEQSSTHFRKWEIPHGLIASGHRESRAFKVHIVSKQTIERRWSQIKNWPDLIIIDECHINYGFQLRLLENIPAGTKIIGMTATPERLDRKGLSDIYQDMVKGAGIKYLIENDYLSNFDYYAPPLQGLDELHKTGTDYKADELEALMQRRAVYGKAIGHYRELANKKKTLCYCRNIKHAEQIAHLFREHGYNFENLDGTMKHKKRREIVSALADGRLDGVTSVNLIAYGFDLPGVENIIMLRPTLSRAMFFQMIGRGLRVSPGKEKCTIFDHVNNSYEHLDLESNKTLIDAMSNFNWNFYGDQKKKKKDKVAHMMKQCTGCWQYFDGVVCPNCGNKRKKMNPKAAKIIDGQLVMITTGLPLKDRPNEERRDIQQRIGDAKSTYNEFLSVGKIDIKPVEDLCKIAKDLDYSVMWVYHQLNELEKTINIPLLSAIRKVKGYKPGWVYFKAKKMRGGG